MLLVHIVGALITGWLVLKSLSAIVKREHTTYATHSKRLILSGGFQIVSGILLVVISPPATLLGACAKLGIYVVVVGGTCLLLSYARSQAIKTTQSV